MKSIVMLLYFPFTTYSINNLTCKSLKVLMKKLVAYSMKFSLSSFSGFFQALTGANLRVSDSIKVNEQILLLMEMLMFT